MLQRPKGLEMNMNGIRVTSEDYVREMLPPRAADIHKGACGRVLLIAGSPGMAGAAVLCARAALRSGAGLVTVCVPRELFPILQTAVPEAMCMDREELPAADLKSFDAVAAGPGLGVSGPAYDLVENVLLSYRGPVVVDADGLNNLCLFGRVPEASSYMGTETVSEQIPRMKTSLLPDICARRKGAVILTPHPGEAERLLESLQLPPGRQLGREKTAEILAGTTGAIVVLKGAGSLVADGGGRGAAARSGEEDKDSPGKNSPPDIFENPTGNPGMASGGSGDVLTGVIAALTAYGQARVRLSGSGLTPVNAARCAVYIHGLAGDLAARDLGEIGMTSMDIAEHLPEAFRFISGR